MTTRSECRQRAGEDLEPEVLFVAEPVRATLEDADLVVQSLDKAERDLVLRAAVGRDPLPVPLNHRRELFVGTQALPLERRPPVLEEAARPAFAAVVPELPERFLEQIGGVQPLVGGEQRRQGPAAAEGQVLSVSQQGVLLPRDESALPPGHPRVLALANLIERVAQMAQDVELVEQDAGLRGVVGGRKAERLPHVHDDEPNPRGLSEAEPRVELVQARLRAIRAPKPDRPLADQVADNDAVGVALLDRDLVEPEHARPGGPRPPQLLAHVLLLEGLHGVPVEPQLLGHIPDRGRPTAPSHVEREALCVEGIVGEKRELLLLHRATAPTGHAPHLDVEVDAQVAAREVADPAVLAVVPPALHPAAGAAGRFFDRRVSVMIRASGSPKIPVTVGLGRTPGKRYASQRRRGRRGVGMRQSCPILARPPQRFRPLPERVSSPSAACFYPLTSTKSQNEESCYKRKALEDAIAPPCKVAATGEHLSVTASLLSGALTGPD